MIFISKLTRTEMIPCKDWCVCWVVTPHHINNCWGSQTSWHRKCWSTQHICCLILQRQSPPQTSVHTGINWSGRDSQQQGSKILGRSWWDALEGIERADMIARLLSVLSEESRWLRKVPDSWRKINIKFIFTRARGRSEELLVSSTSVSGKTMEYFLLDSISKHMKDKNVIRSSWHRNTKGIMLHQPDCLLWWNDCEWRKSSECNISWKAFETISHSIFNSSLRQCGMGGLLEELKISRIDRLQG